MRAVSTEGSVQARLRPANATAVWVDRTMRTARAQLEVDEILVDRVRRDPRRSWVRVWRNQRCLVATAREAANPAFAEAARSSQARGWPVVVRRSGGTAVPHESGMLQITTVTAAAPPIDIETGYASLTRPLVAALARLGAVDVNVRELAGSVCDGRYNLNLAGRKVCGTSQRWIAPRAPYDFTIVLGHAVLFVDVELAAAVGAVDAFYRDLCLSRRFDVEAHTDCRALPLVAAASDRWGKVATVVAEAFLACNS